MKPVFSVVMPVYKSERYLERCVDSIVNQQYPGLEIILVDDGSPDNCPKLCDQWAERDQRVKVLHKENAGLGEARNSGIDVAKGEYIVFFDSDDFVDPGFFSSVAAVIEKYGCADVIEFGHRVLDASGRVVSELMPHAPKPVYKGREVQEVFLPELVAADPRTGRRLGVYMSAWCCVYRLEALRKCNFHFTSEREIISEDIYSLLDLMSDVNSVIILNAIFYNYCQNEGSLTKVYREDRFEKVLDFYLQSRELCISKNYSKEVLWRLCAPFITFVLACLKMEVGAVKQNGWRKTYKRVKAILVNPELQHVLKTYPLKSYPFTRKVIHFFMKRRLTTGVILLLYAH